HGILTAQRQLEVEVLLVDVEQPFHRITFGARQGEAHGGVHVPFRDSRDQQLGPLGNGLARQDPPEPGHQQKHKPGYGEGFQIGKLELRELLADTLEDSLWIELDAAACRAFLDRIPLNRGLADQGAAAWSYVKDLKTLLANQARVDLVARNATSRAAP